MKAADTYLRWRHSRGFGVHSPFAYHIVSEVLTSNSRYGYYAYEALDALAMRHPGVLDQRLLRLIYRLMVAIDATGVEVVGEARAQALCNDLQALTPGVAGAPLLVVLGSTPLADLSPRAAFFANASHPSLAGMTGRMTAGHIYHNPRRAIVLPYDHLPLQTFEVNF